MTTTTDEIYLKAEEINDYQQTFRDILNRLESESKAQGEDNHCQVVMQLNPQTDGKQWKMFIYYTDNGHFCYSYQDQNLMDTMTYPGIDLEQMIALMLEDMHAVDGIEWITVDS